MNYLSIDYLIVYAFLLLTLVIGFLAGRDIKDMRGHAIANKQFVFQKFTFTVISADARKIKKVAIALEKNGAEEDV